MSLRVYNTLTRQKESFQTVHPGRVGIYVCGPTVYKSPHIGHMVGPVIFDVIKRYLTHKGFAVTWIVNITDIEDKLIDAAQQQKTTVAALSEKHTREYMECLAMLGVDTIDRFPKASEHIAEIVSLCEKLIERGHAYAADGSVYFDVTTDADYGKLSHQRVEEQQAGSRDVEGTGKRNAADFALWKAAKPGEPSWDSPWGKGRPGWHIECSVMSMKYLGTTLDCHGGGMDLLFPHHENELAQSESATGRPFVKYWMHNGLTRVNTKKISGSDAATAEGAATLAALAARKLIQEQGAELIRYMLLSTQYRSPIDFSGEVLASSRKGLAVFHRLFERVERLAGGPIAGHAADMDECASRLADAELGPFAKAVLAHKSKYMEMMDDDFNTAGAIAAMHELASTINAFVEQKELEKDKIAGRVHACVAATSTLRELGLLLGLFRKELAKADGGQSELVGQLMALLIQLRQDARKGKNFALADGIRKGLAQIGITLEDRADGTLWRKDT